MNFSRYLQAKSVDSSRDSVIATVLLGYFAKEISLRALFALLVSDGLVAGSLLLGQCRRMPAECLQTIVDLAFAQAVRGESVRYGRAPCGG